MKLNNQLNHQIAQYRQQLAKNPPIFDKNTGYEMKECQGCYCQLFADSQPDFCFDCLDCEVMACGNSNPYLGQCCACYGKKIGNPKLKRKQLTFTQRQRLNWEQIIRNAGDKIAEIKDREDPNNMRTVQDIVNRERWAEQSKKRELESFSSQELEQELKRRHEMNQAKNQNQNE